MRAQRWNQIMDMPLMAAAVLFLAAYAIPVLWPTSSETILWSCSAVSWSAWVLFALDYLIQVALAEDRSRYVLHNLLMLAVVVLPLLRPLRLLRLVPLLSVLNRKAGASLRGRIVSYTVGATTLLLFVASLAVLDTERDVDGSNIKTFGDACWWAVTTMTTVGYGDRYPVSGTGRLIAFGLMLGGIALLGLVTATLASWLVERVTEKDEAAQAATQLQVQQLSSQIDELRQLLAAREEPKPVAD